MFIIHENMLHIKCFLLYFASVIADIFTNVLEMF